MMDLLSLFDLCSKNGVDILVRNNISTNDGSGMRYFIHVYIANPYLMISMRYTNDLQMSIDGAYEDLKKYIHFAKDGMKWTT